MATSPDDERVLIFQNLLNGVPAAQVARDFHKQSEEEVMRIFSSVLRKIKSYVFQRRLPIIGASTLVEIRSKYKMTCLGILPKLNLDKEPKHPNIITEVLTVDNAESVVREIAR